MNTERRKPAGMSRRDALRHAGALVAGVAAACTPLRIVLHDYHLVTFGLTPSGGVLETDANGRLTLRLDPTHALQRYHDDTEAVLHDILRRNGCREVRAQFVNQGGEAREELFFSTAHQVGSCRMAVRKADGVVDAAGQVFDHPGLYVSDGSAIPSSLAVNTSLTILANAERVAAGIIARNGLKSPVFS